MIMGFLKRLFGTEEKQDSKPKIKSKQPQKPKENKQESNSFLEQLELIINEAKTMVSKSPKVDTIQNLAHDIVEGFFYGNVIINFKNNLNEENQKELNISDKDVNKIEKKFGKLFERCEQTLESGSNKGKITIKEFEDFKKDLKQISENSYKLLLELEKHIDINACQNRIKKFKEEIKNLGKELKIGNIGSKDGSLGISIGFEGDDEDYEDSDFDEEITEFNNFSLEMDGEWLTIEDEQGGHFYGQYHISKNGRYIVGFCDGYEDASKGKSKWVAGQVYLIENKKKILWRKEIARPEHAFVNNSGVVFVIDWVSTSGELTGKVYLFNDKGKRVFELKFDSNIGGQGISDDGEEGIITTCFPENAIYLFNLEKNKLVKKVENTTKDRPLVNFNFNTIKDFINKSPEFNQEDYDLQKKKEETESEEEQERIKSLKKKNILDLNHDELVMVASEYAGDFYGNFGEPQKALKYILGAIELKKDKPQPYVLKLAGFCYEKIENYEEAIKYYNWSIERYPQYKKSVVIDHIDFCNLKLTNKYKNDWTTYIVNKREKERNSK